MKRLFHISKYAPAVREEAYWVLSCIISKSSDTVGVIIDNPEYIKQLVKSVFSNDNLEVPFSEFWKNNNFFRSKEMPL